MTSALKVGIAGLGLIGGSITKALLEKPEYELHIVSQSQAEGLKEDGKRRTLADLAEMDLLFLCGPQSQIKRQLEEIALIINKSSKEGTVPAEERAFAKTIITDVGSTKDEICAIASELGLSNFIGGHPMAGTEEVGFESSFAQLFGNCTWILTESNEKTALLEKIILGDLGAGNIHVVDPLTHDKCVAAISHLPLILSIGLGDLLRDVPAAKAMIGPGFAGMTRLAKGNETLGKEIINANRKNIREVWGIYKENIDSFLDISGKNLVDEIGAIKAVLSK